MDPNKILVVFLVLIVGICFADVPIKTTESSVSSELMDATLNILASCYGDRGPIGVLGNVPRTLLRKLSKKLIPVILFDMSKRKMRYNVKDLDAPRRTVHVFLVIATSRQQAAENLKTIYNLRWFNPSASYLAVSVLPKMKNGCMHAGYLLWLIVRNKMFNANILCIHSENRILIYGHNPHMNQAPHPWGFFGNYTLDNEIIFVFKQRYREGKEICNNLDYDKTKVLGGKAIALIADSNDCRRVDINFSRLNERDMKYITYLHFWEIYFRQINATAVMTRDDTVKGILFYPFDLHSITFAPHTMPIFEHYYVIVTQFRGDKSQLSKILTVIDRYSRYCVGLTLFITLIFFKVFAHQHFIPGMLNVIRMICNTGFTNLPENVSSRIYLVCLFLFIVTIQGIFSGDLASLLTNSIPVPHARTLQDLIDMNYITYTEEEAFTLLTQPKYESSLVPAVNMVDCPDSVSHNASIACIGDKDVMVDEAVRLKLYMSSNNILTSYRVLKFTPMWTFVDRSTEIFLRMTEARILEPLYIKVRKIRLNEINQYKREHKPPRVMTLDDLGFAFAILGIGLGCAVLSFIIEISINPVRSRIAKVRTYFGH